MKKPYHVTNLTRVLEIGKDPEQEPHPSEYGHFDKNRYFVSNDPPGQTIYFPWEWIYMPDIVEYARECGIELPDGTIDFSKTF